MYIKKDSSEKIELNAIKNHSKIDVDSLVNTLAEDLTIIMHFLSVVAPILLRNVMLHFFSYPLIDFQSSVSVTILTPLQYNSYDYPYLHLHSLKLTATASTPSELSSDSQSCKCHVMPTQNEPQAVLT